MKCALSASWYSRSSRKRPSREFEKVVVTSAGRLRELLITGLTEFELQFSQTGFHNGGRN